MTANMEHHAKIMIVDDVETNRAILEEILSAAYEIEQAEDGIDALSQLFNSIQKPHLVLLDIMMPGMNGFEVLKLMKGDPMLQKIPVIFITAVDDEIKALNAGAVDYISKPFNPEIVKLRVANHIELNLYRQSLEELVAKKADELVAVRENSLETMAGLIEQRSLESGQHVQRTRELADILVTQLLETGVYSQSLIEGDYFSMVKAVPLHDIGKVGIPDSILLKPGRLTPEEFKIMETHTTIGSAAIHSMMIVGDDPYLKHCYDICRSHHERWDGNGYPDKLAGTDIPLSARIVAVVDVYDALVSERCYKQPIAHEEAVDIIRKSSGSHFDPDIVTAMLKSNEKFKACSH